MIAVVDMHLRDQKVLDYIAAQGNEARVLQREVAAHFHCTEKTAAAMIRRLCGAGLLIRHNRPRKRGYTYEVVRRVSA
jgi:DNA-binding MarR family transcriptional regulator